MSQPEPAQPVASVGRVVHVHLPSAHAHGNNGADVAPAIITRAWHNDLVNVHVLLDGHDTRWLTSVLLKATEAEARAIAADTRCPVAFWPGRS